MIACCPTLSWSKILPDDDTFAGLLAKQFANKIREHKVRRPEKITIWQEVDQHQGTKYVLWTCHVQCAINYQSWYYWDWLGIEFNLQISPKPCAAKPQDNFINNIKRKVWHRILRKQYDS